MDPPTPHSSVMLQDLPPELLHNILRNVSRDLPTLRAVSLTCRRLLPIARELLFAVVGCEAFGQEFMAPYLDCIIELRLRPSNSHTRPSWHDYLNDLLQRFRPHILPRLTRVAFLSLQFWDVVAIPPHCFQALERFETITELTLSGMSFLGLRHVQAFVCALPNLNALNLHRIMYADRTMARRFSAPVVEYADLNTNLHSRPRLKRLAFSPDVTTMATTEIAEWLARGPCVGTLETIVVPFSARAPQYVVSRFGPGIKHLSMPLRTLDQMENRGQLNGYTDVRTLTVFMDSYNMSPGSWYMLGPVLEAGIPSRTIDRLTIDVRVEFETEMSAVVDWLALDKVNDLLDDAKFDALEEVEFVMQIKKELGWDPAEEARWLLNRVEERLCDVVDAGKRVITRYWLVEEFYDTIVSMKTGVL